MCGIFGRVGPPTNSEYDAASLAHRGPDDFGSYAAPVAGTPATLHLAQRRLSIIDLSPCGHQPMSNEDGSIWVVFNGEIYNFIELRSELIRSGHQFRSRTDTETIIHGYEQWGDAFVDRLRGMFAFGLWDGRRNRLLLARDRVGKKPLFYALTRDRLLFGSEIKALLATGELDTQPDALALHDYLTYLYFPPPRTAYKSISKLPPASCMAVEVSASGALETRQWSFWDAAEAASVPQNGSERQLIGRARELIDEAVRVRLISDVPLGVFLSGGIDSSTITAVTAKHTPGRVKTFTISFPEHAYYNEVDAAGEVSRTLRTEHHILPAAPESASYLGTVIRHFDEPFGNPTAILQYILAKLTRPYVTVALSGEGGDELFGGYPRYLGANLARHYRNLPRFVTRGLVARLADLLGETTDGRHGFRRAREFAHFAWQPEEDMYLHWLGYFSEQEKRELYTPEFATEVGEYESGDFLRQLFRRGAHLEPLSRLSYVDICSFLTCNLLEYSDRMSMANSLEVRCPYTDSKLIEFALGLPAEMKLRGRRGKWIITEAFRGELPARILERRKVGFNPPVGQWLKSALKPMLEDYLGESRVVQRGMFRPQAITRLISEHQSGKRDNSLKIWALFALEEWMRMYIDHRTAPDDVMTRERVGAA